MNLIGIFGDVAIRSTSAVQIGGSFVWLRTLAEVPWPGSGWLASGYLGTPGATSGARRRP